MSSIPRKAPQVKEQALKEGATERRLTFAVEKQKELPTAHRMRVLSHVELAVTWEPSPSLLLIPSCVLL
jgi:hypothetical protein